jgi:hypothetical protein
MKTNSEFYPKKGENFSLLGTLILIAFSFAIGFLSGFYTNPNLRIKNENIKYDKFGQRSLCDLIDVNKIKENFRILTRSPHLAGTIQDKQTAEYVRNKLLSFGLDSVEIVDYDVLLDYPDADNFNKYVYFLLLKFQFCYFENILIY